MNTSQTGFLSAILAGGKISQATLGYFRERLQNRIHQFVLQQFIDKQKSGLTQADIARSLDRRPEQITRWLGTPSNWTIDTISDLVLAISRGELTFSLSPLVGDNVIRNIQYDTAQETNGNTTSIAYMDATDTVEFIRSVAFGRDIIPTGQTSTETNVPILSLNYKQVAA